MKHKSEIIEKLIGEKKKYRYDEDEPVSPEIAAQFTWGVFKDGNIHYANSYHQEMTYPSMVKGNMSQEDAEKMAAEKNK